MVIYRPAEQTGRARPEEMDVPPLERAGLRKRSAVQISLSGGAWNPTGIARSGEAENMSRGY